VGAHRIVNRFLVIFLLASSLLALSVATSHQAASAGTRAKHEAAFLWARAHAGHPYCWGSSGPSCFDCSGLVMAAYARAGISLPHNTVAMLGSGKLIRERARAARRGDLAFYGSGHVELVGRKVGVTFGAAHTGTLIGWHHYSWAGYHPTMFFRVRGAG